MHVVYYYPRGGDSYQKVGSGLWWLGGGGGEGGGSVKWRDPTLWPKFTMRDCSLFWFLCTLCVRGEHKSGQDCSGGYRILKRGVPMQGHGHQFDNSHMPVYVCDGME